MKLLVFSDSHGNSANMCQVAAVENPDRVLHLGDVMSDADILEKQFAGIQLERVPGNCDYSSGQPQKIIEAAGRRILMTHGHIYHVKLGIGAAVWAAREAQVDILLFGHTHEAICMQEDGLWIMNPGSIRGPVHPSYGVIQLEKGQIICEIKEWKRGAVKNADCN